MTGAAVLRRRIRTRLARSVPELPVAFMVAVAVEVGLRVTTLPRLARILGIRMGQGEGTLTHDEPIVLPRWSHRRVRATSRVLGRWPFGTTCLRQCLVLGQRLRLLDPILCIGVRAESDGKWLAHSWLEIDGRSLDPASSTFLPLEGR